MIAIDLGSNTFRALQYGCESGEREREFERVVKTADDLHKTGIVSDEALERIAQAFDEARGTLDFSQPVRAVTTAALRMAKNQSDCLQKLAKTTGITFEVITAEEEARLGALAVSHRLGQLGLPLEFLMLDIGGGSTELVFWQQDKMLYQSFDIGIVTYAQKYRSREAILAAVRKSMEAVEDFISDAHPLGFRPKLFCGTAGTPTTLAAIKEGMLYADYDYHRVNGKILQPGELDSMESALLKISMAEREKRVGTGRADLIMTGIMIFREIFALSGFKECVVIDDGLREGVAIEMCKKRES